MKEDEYVKSRQIPRYILSDNHIWYYHKGFKEQKKAERLLRTTHIFPLYSVDDVVDVPGHSGAVQCRAGQAYHGLILKGDPVQDQSHIPGNYSVEKTWNFCLIIIVCQRSHAQFS